MFECDVELSDKVSKSSKGERSSRDGTLAEGRGPGKGRPFGHVQKSESNLFVVIVIDRFIDKEVELHSMQPVLRFLIGSVERFGGADVEFSGFRSHWWGWGKAGEER